jgi:predicted transcriptional regulator
MKPEKMVSSSRRGKLELYGDILAVVDEETSQLGSAGLTRVQLKCNMPYDRFKESLLRLKERGLVGLTDVNGSPATITLTQPGREFLETYRRVRKFMETYQL